MKNSEGEADLKNLRKFISRTSTGKQFFCQSNRVGHNFSVTLLKAISFQNGRAKHDYQMVRENIDTKEHWSKAAVSSGSSYMLDRHDLPL